MVGGGWSTLLGHPNGGRAMPLPLDAGMLTDPSFQKRPSRWMAVSAHLRRGDEDGDGGSTGGEGI